MASFSVSLFHGRLTSTITERLVMRTNGYDSDIVANMNWKSNKDVTEKLKEQS